MKKINDYVKESIIELKKVTWPSKKDTYRYSVLVIVISLLIAAFLGGLDYIFNFGLEILITR
jgi:preprotein translocase subunit SecE